MLTFIPALATYGTPLHEACSEGNAAALQQILKEQQEEGDEEEGDQMRESSTSTTSTTLVNMPTSDGQTPLWVLARRQQQQQQQQQAATTLQGNINNNSNNNANLLQCWKLLLAHGADPAIPWNGSSLLSYLCATNQTAVVSIVLNCARHPCQEEERKCCNDSTMSTSSWQVGPLDIAVRNLNAPLVRLLAQHPQQAHGCCAQFTFLTQHLAIPLRLPLTQYGCHDGNSKPSDDAGTSAGLSDEALHDTVLAFLQVAPDPNVYGADGNTLLHLCAMFWKKDGCYDSPTITTRFATRISQLLHAMVHDYGVDLNLPSTAASSCGRTALMLAAEAQNSVWAVALCRAGARVDPQDADGCTSLCFAQDVGVVQAMLSARGGGGGGGTRLLEEATRQGTTTPLLEAVQSTIPRRRRIDALLEAGASVTARHAVTGQTAMHLAVRAGRADALKLLLSALSSTKSAGHYAANVRDYRGRTPLHELGTLLNDNDDNNETAIDSVDCTCKSRRRRRRNPHGYGRRQAEEFLEILQVLLAHHADAAARDDQGNLPFFQAAAIVPKEPDDQLFFFGCSSRSLLSSASASCSACTTFEYPLTVLYKMISVAATSGLFRRA